MIKKMAWILALLSFAVFLAEWASHAETILAWARYWALYYKGFVQAYPMPCWLALLAAGSLAITSPIPLAALVKLLAGYFFGVQAGFVLNVCVSVLGGFAGFAASRYLFYKPLYARFSHQLARANLEIARHGFWYVLSARLFLATPFFLVNVLAGLSCIRKRKFLLGTFLGVLPSSMIYAVSGSHLEAIREIADLANPRLAAVLAAVGAAAVIPALLGRKKKKRS
ncbi:TVP38/TMEM64 family protein [Fundidesulfovibrio terrae]|uniref:TVP38/TMEM64 family protein n=1 Tax=Fundidesulfovibrio terrae TaxID=2922866 RepID=UPI001FAEE6F8|nr:VTT domain-containing protein [Fundidesulfovibrio terrae]